jgi:DNA-binding NarL/FixJ family response regulator
MNRARILLADDHGLLLEAFKKLLEPEHDIIGTVNDGRSLLKVAPELHPDIVILDIAMPLLNGLDACQQLRHMMPGVKLMFLTVNPDPDVASKAFRLGASAYLLKSSAASELFQAIREVLEGRAYVTPLIRDGMVQSFIQHRDRKASDKLTARQREVLQLLAEGYSMKQTADILNVTPRTVAFHKYRMMSELRLKSNAELIQFAIQHSLVSTSTRS